MLGNPDGLPERAGGRTQGKLIGGAQALYWTKPTAQELNGFDPEDYSSPEQQRSSVYYDLEAKDGEGPEGLADRVPGVIINPYRFQDAGGPVWHRFDPTGIEQTLVVPAGVTSCAVYAKPAHARTARTRLSLGSM